MREKLRRGSRLAQILWQAVLSIGVFMLANASWAGSVRQPEANPNKAAPTSYRVDAARSRFEIKVTSAGFLKMLGHNHTVAVRNFTGEVQLSDLSPQTAHIQILIQAKSLTLADTEVSPKDRHEIESTMRDSVLEVSKYPEIRFTSKKVAAEKSNAGGYKVDIEGDLTLHGMTRHIVVPAWVRIDANQIEARGEPTLKQTDYGIKPVSIAGGTVKVNNVVGLVFDIVAVRK